MMIQHLIANMRENLLGTRRSVTPSCDEVVKETQFSNLQYSTGNDHFWQGSTGPWRQHPNAADINEIRTAHATIFEQVDYDMADGDRLTAKYVFRSSRSELCQ
jgi:hypothetical protein